MQRKKDQTQRILDFYVGGLSENKCFDRLKNLDFLDILSKSTAIHNLDEFVNVIKRVAEEKGIPSKCPFCCCFFYQFQLIPIIN